MAVTRDRQVRGPARLYTAMSFALVGFLGVAAVTTRQSSPPTVAEFAADGASASEDGSGTISEDARRVEAGRESALSSPTRPIGGTGAASTGAGTGRGDGPGPAGSGPAVTEGADPRGAPGSEAADTSPAVPMVSAPCFDDRRQVEDPQSPPCRRTGPRYLPEAPRAKGVTADGRIVVAYPRITQLGGGNLQQGVDQVWAGLEHYVNSHFMFYGREIDLVPYQPRNSFSANVATPAAAIADAETVNQLGAFAALGYIYDNAGNHFEDRLAQLGIISAKATVAPVDEQHYSRAGTHPYQWSYLPTANQIQASGAAWICSQLEGRAPAHARAPIHASIPAPTKRRFGLIVNQFPDSLTNTSILEDRLARCGVTISGEARVESLYKNESSPTPEVTAAVLRLINDGVTSVICICHVNAARLGFQPAAEDQRYRPEWLFTSFGHNDYQSALAFAPGDNNARRSSGVAEQMGNSFGLSFRPKTLPSDALPITKILAEVYGHWDWSEINAPNQNNGTQKEWSAQMYNWQYWKPLLLLASGIQQAGPDLTALAFANGSDSGTYPGLQGTQFPNPQTPDHAGSVGFASDHSMVDDATMIWWSNEEASNWGNCSYQCTRNVPGTWCYADSGRRYSFFDWAGSSASLFKLPCY